MSFEVTVLGCGEAFDERYTNTSLLVRAEGKTILLDCGYSAPAPLWDAVREPNELDLIYISHAHADHCFGLPAVLGRMWEDGRRKPLTVVSQPPLLEQLRAAMDSGYPGLAARFQYPIDYRKAVLERPLEWESFRFSFAPTRHSVTNLAVRVEAGPGRFCYSGDGQFTDESRALFAGVDLLVHEAYSFDPSPIHGDFAGVIRMAGEQSVRKLALVHVKRNVRREEWHRIEALAAYVPEPGEKLALY